MWVLAATDVFSPPARGAPGHLRCGLVRRDVPDLWPMIRHSFLFGRRPQATAQFNPLQKLVLGCLALETIQPASLARSPRRAGYGGRGTGAGYRDVPRGSALTITTTRLLGGRASG